MNVLVYAGPEVVQLSLNHTLICLKTLLFPNYSVQAVTSQSLSSHPWSVGCAMLVFPSCKGASSIPNIAAVKAYVENGGVLLGLGAGAICSSRASGIPAANVPNGHTLRLFDQKTGSYIYPSFDSGDAATAVSIQVDDGVAEVSSFGMATFVGTEDEKYAVPVAKYSDGKTAAIRLSISKGRVVLWSCNPEFPSASGSTDALRLQALRHTITELGLNIPVRDSVPIAGPQPQYLTASRKEDVTAVLEGLKLSVSATAATYKDESDSFVFHAAKDTENVLRETRSRSSDPSTWNPKHIIVHSDNTHPAPESTPLFKTEAYYAALGRSREAAGCTPSTSGWACGEVAFYSEAVTSTQTMLEKNPRFLADLPTPTLSIASHQLAGRGRGLNTWLSPAGCLQFSLHIRVSTTQIPTSKLVFVQYLFGLAVVEACRSDSVMGASLGDSTRLKWPNDIYALLGPSEQDRRKIGGVLINTSFMGSQINVIIGCGLNVLNPPPITSISQLMPSHATQLTMENTMAAIMAQWDRMWGTFLAHKGSFEPFMALYLKRWLHSDQLVTLTTTVPPRQVRITGITPDHGLLRTKPERVGGWSRGDEGFIDLQPDGNSFDIMAGMIKTK